MHTERDLSRRVHRLLIRTNISHPETCLVHGDQYFIGLHVVVAAEELLFQLTGCFFRVMPVVLHAALATKRLAVEAC